MELTFPQPITISYAIYGKQCSKWNHDLNVVHGKTSTEPSGISIFAALVLRKIYFAGVITAFSCTEVHSTHFRSEKTWEKLKLKLN